MLYLSVIFGFFILWIASGVVFSGANGFIKRHFGTIGIVFITWFHAIYYISHGTIVFAKGGGFPIRYSEEPVLFTFLIISMFGMGFLAIYFDEALNKNINFEKNKNIIIPDQDHTSLCLRKRYCPHCDEIVDKRATICLSCGEQLNRNNGVTKQKH